MISGWLTTFARVVKYDFVKYVDYSKEDYRYCDKKLDPLLYHFRVISVLSTVRVALLITRK